jgi:GT2 family glycosyltransferase
MTTRYQISVVIPTYQRRASVERALRALAQQTMRPIKYEVIVSIDGSDDGTRDMVAQFPTPYRLRSLWQPNRGRAAACNAGIDAADGEVIVLLDDDMEAAPGFLMGHYKAHDAGERLGVLGAAPIHIEPSSPPLVKYIGSGFNSRLQRFAQPGYTIQFKEAYTGNFSIRRSVMRRVGAFDEDFKVYGYEDYELALRLAQAGVRLIYCAGALAHQHYRKDFAGLARDSIASGRTAVLFASKHAGAFRDLKLSHRPEWSPLRRLFHTGLLALSKFWPGTPDGVIAFVRWLERREPARLDLYYTLALEYCYWLGAQSALRENRRTGRGLASLPQGLS